MCRFSPAQLTKRDGVDEDMQDKSSDQAHELTSKADPRNLPMYAQLLSKRKFLLVVAVNPSSRLRRGSMIGKHVNIAHVKSQPAYSFVQDVYILPLNQR